MSTEWEGETGRVELALKHGLAVLVAANWAADNLLAANSSGPWDPVHQDPEQRS